MLVRYLGPFDAVTLEPGATAPVTVPRGDTVDLPDDLAAALCEQECWEAVKPPKSAKES
jgi:hypothetical protein